MATEASRMYVLPAGREAAAEHRLTHKGRAVQHKESIFVAARDTHTVV